MPLFDNLELKDSFVFDLPESGFNEEIDTYILVSEAVIKVLLYQGVFRIIQNHNFGIRKCFKRKISGNLLSVLERNIQKYQGIQIDLELVSKQEYYFIAVQKKNAIFYAKKLVVELAEKYSLFSKEKIVNMESYCWEKGMFTALNYQCCLEQMEQI